MATLSSLRANMFSEDAGDLSLLQRLDGSGRLTVDNTQRGAPPKKRRKEGKIYSGCGTCKARKIKCDQTRPRCHNCDGYIGSGSEQNSIISSQTSQVWPDAVAETASWRTFLDGVIDCDSSETSIAWDEFETPFGRQLESQPQLANVELPQSTYLQRPFELPLPDSGRMQNSWLVCGKSRHTTDSIDKLIYHWRIHACGLMMPTLAPSQNPWLKLYLPLALQGPATAPKRGLLYALLASAAFNLAYLKPTEKSTYLAQAREFCQKADDTLLAILNDDDSLRSLSLDKLSKQALLAASLTISTTEVFSGSGKANGYKYLKLSNRIFKATGGVPWWSSDPSCLTLIQIFRCLRVVALTSGWSQPPSTSTETLNTPEYPSQGHLQTPRFFSIPAIPGDTFTVIETAEYPLEVTFGISPKSLRCLNEITDLAHLRAENANANADADEDEHEREQEQESWPSSILPSLLDLEAEIFSTFDGPDAFANTPAAYTSVTGSRGGDPISPYVANVIKENHMWAFHCSTALFFRRALCYGGGGTITITDTNTDTTPNASANVLPTARTKHLRCQSLVSKALAHLENIDALSRDAGIANTLWAGFVAAAEAMDTGLRQRALIWLERARRHGIGNIPQAMEVVMEVWRRVDRCFGTGFYDEGLEGELGPVDWRDVMREMDLYIMLT